MRTTTMHFLESIIDVAKAYKLKVGIIYESSRDLAGTLGVPRRLPTTVKIGEAEFYIASKKSNLWKDRIFDMLVFIDIKEDEKIDLTQMEQLCLEPSKGVSIRIKDYW